VDSAVWLLPALAVRFLVGSHTWKGLCPIWNRKHKSVAQPEDNQLFPQQGASFSEYGVNVCVPITIFWSISTPLKTLTESYWTHTVTCETRHTGGTVLSLIQWYMDLESQCCHSQIHPFFSGEVVEAQVQACNLVCICFHVYSFLGWPMFWST